VSKRRECDKMAAHNSPRRGRLVKIGKRSNIRKRAQPENAGKLLRHTSAKSDKSRNFLQPRELQASQEAQQVGKLFRCVRRFAWMPVGKKDICERLGRIVMEKRASMR
jgi:hypothetical protein